MSLFLQQKKCLFVGFLLLWVANALATPKVVVTIKPIHSLTLAVMDGVAVPELLLPDLVSPHTFQLKPSTFKQLHQADVIIWVGHDLESFMIKALKQIHPPLGLITLQTLPQLKLLPQRQGRQWEHRADHTHSLPHSHDSLDPHFWLSTDNAMIIIDYLADYLSKIDPIHTKHYLLNADRTKKRIQIVKGRLVTLLENVHDKPFLVYHDGYQYFENEFHLNGVGTMVINPHLPLSARGLKTIQNLIHTQKVTCVFRETEFNDTSIYNSLKKLDVKVAELDPLGARIPPGPRNYENTLISIGKTMEACLQGKSN